MKENPSVGLGKNGFQFRKWVVRFSVPVPNCNVGSDTPAHQRARSNQRDGMHQVVELVGFKSPLERHLCGAFELKNPNGLGSADHGKRLRVFTVTAPVVE